MEWSTSLRPRLSSREWLCEQGVSDRTLDTVAHEFFHVWNVKRLPTFDLVLGLYATYDTRGLWIAEGFTKLLRPLDAPVGAGLWDDARFLRKEASTIAAIENSSGNRL